MGFFSREPTIKGNERQECLAYYEEEKKLRLLFERVEQLFDKRVGKYENELFGARRRGDDFLASLEKIGEVHEYIAQAADEILKRKKQMKSCSSSAASVMSVSWLIAYSSYRALRDPSNIVAGFQGVEVEIRRQRAKEWFTHFNKSLHRAWKDEKEFGKRLKLTSSEYKRIVDNAERAVAADEWLQKLEKDIP